MLGGCMTLVSNRFTRAIDHARLAHAAQVRKGSNIPYLYTCSVSPVW